MKVLINFEKCRYAPHSSVSFIDYIPIINMCSSLLSVAVLKTMTKRISVAFKPISVVCGGPQCRGH